MPALLHEDAVLTSKVRPGTTVRGRDEVVRFIQEAVAPSLYDATADVYTLLDEERVIVEGRLRWIDDERVIRDDPVVWAMEFCDGLVLRFLAARTAVEAESLLAASR